MQSRWIELVPAVSRLMMHRMRRGEDMTFWRAHVPVWVDVLVGEGTTGWTGCRWLWLWLPDCHSWLPLYVSACIELTMAASTLREVTCCRPWTALTGADTITTRVYIRRVISLTADGSHCGFRPLSQSPSSRPRTKSAPSHGSSNILGSFADVWSDTDPIRPHGVGWSGLYVMVVTPLAAGACWAAWADLVMVRRGRPRRLLQSITLALHCPRLVGRAARPSDGRWLRQDLPLLRMDPPASISTSLTILPRPQWLSTHPGRGVRRPLALRGIASTIFFSTRGRGEEKRRRGREA